jgi:hypothetical protein
MHRRPSTATAIALLALFVALGGSAIAASRYVITSTGQIKPNVLRAIRGAPLGQLVEVHGALTSTTSVAASQAQCPAGDDIVSGGYSAVLGPNGYVNQDEPVGTHSWWAGVSMRLTGERATVTATALCAPAGRAVAASQPCTSPSRPLPR